MPDPPAMIHTLLKAFHCYVSDKLVDTEERDQIAGI